ncbi:MAG: hypothetical protein QME52_08535 [Bacteroidota bacterium]|nr:hypothetical protein [Bacteroidota bacterium]
MKQTNRCLLTFIILIAGIVLLGCSKDDNTSPQIATDENVLTQQVSELDSIAEFSSADEAAIDDESLMSMDKTSFTKTTDTIDPLRWMRKVENIQRSVNVIKIGDTIAIATLNKTITGRMIILAHINMSLDTIQKQFTTEVKRRIKFVRVARTQEILKNWLPVAITPVFGQTTGPKTFGITEIEIYTPQDTIVLTDSVMHWFYFGPGPNRIPKINEGDSVIVRVHVQSTNQNREYVVIRKCYHHRFTNRFRTRMAMIDSTGSQNQYERAYEHRFAAPLPQFVLYARYNAIIDAMSYDSINDDAAPFMNMFVGIPYIVKR